MQTKPAGWPADSAVEVVPEAFLVLPGSSWPPASGDVPAGTAELATWSVDRELTGSNLPGQVRGASGFSVATASATFAQPDAQLVPWGQGVQAIGPGGKARLVMSHAGSTGAGLRLGSFIVQPITGANNDPAVTLELAEDSINLRKPVTLPIVLNKSESGSVLDAVWLIDQVARRGGYYSTPKPSPSCLCSLPLQGSILAEVGSNGRYALHVSAWRSLNGGVYPAGTWEIFAHLRQPLPRPGTLYATLNVSGKVSVVVGSVSVSIDADAKVFSVGGKAGVSYSSGGSEAWPGRIQIQMEHVASGGVVTDVRARVRSGPSAAWSGWSTSGAMAVVNEEAQVIEGVAVSAFGAGTLNGLQITRDPDVGLWDAPTALLEPTGSLLDAVIVPGARDGWGLIQEITAATQGAAWVDETGVFNYRGYESLRGVGGTVETIEAMDSLESLQWRIDPADVADRVSLTYTPADVQRVINQSLFVWEATEPVQIGAGKTVTINVDLEGMAADSLAGWLPVWNATASTRYSRWAAATSREGAGAQPADTALQVTAEMVTPSRVTIRITNTTTSTLWTVDGNGNTVLILRANVVARMGEPRTIATGVPADRALAPLEIDLGVWVQDDDAAQRYLAWLTGQTTKAKATIEQVRVKPDLARQLGDVVKLTDGTTGLSTKALVTGVHLSGDHGAYTQNLNLALLDYIWADVDTALAKLGLTTFQQLDNYLAANNINTFADFDNWLNTLEGTQ